MLRRPHWPAHENRLLVALALLALVLIVWHHAAGKRQSVSLPERAARGGLWPVQSLVTTACLAAGNLAQGAVQAKRNQEELERLRQERDELLAETLSLRGYYLEHKLLQEQIGLPPPDPRQMIPGRVIDATSAPASTRRITIEVSPGATLTEGAPVRTATGLVGRILSVQGRRATVVLLTDASSSVSAKIERTRDTAILRAPDDVGLDDQMLRLEYVPKAADIRVGDVVMTSGHGGIYPPGLPIGNITAIRHSLSSDVSRSAVVAPFADFRRLEYVLVVQG
jgi:rod shape-determining protein MreC